MHLRDINAHMGALADTAGRADAACALASAMGANVMVLLVVDPEIDALVAAPGSGHGTLPGGAEWRALLAACRVPGVHRFSVPWATRMTTATGCCANGVVALLIGGDVTDADAALLVEALPVLGAALSAQQALAITRGELAAARYEISQSAAVMRALDEARREVDQTLRELDEQARTLEVARHRAEAAARAKDEFLAMLGHELRNPLAPISTALELLRRRGEWSPEHDIMRRQVEHMMRLVDDLLDVARIAGGKLALDLQSVALRDVVGRAVESAHSLIERGAHPLHVEVPADVCVKGDPQRLAQVFSNLLTNAAKYSDDGTPIAITARRRGDVVAIQVLDRGIGIDPAKLESIFELFEQQAYGIDRAQGGLGLGLAIARNLVQLHGGSVRAENRDDGPGSRFTVELPALAAAPVGTADPPTSTPERAGSGRLLLVDDNVDAAVTLAMVLEMVGYEVRTAFSGPDALKVAQEFRPQAAVLDIGLPGMDGYELAGALRDAASGPMPLIALTGYGQSEDRIRTAAAGFDAHFVKPVDLAALCDQLEQLTAGWNPHEAPASNRACSSG